MSIYNYTEEEAVEYLKQVNQALTQTRKDINALSIELDRVDRLIDRLDDIIINL